MFTRRELLGVSAAALGMASLPGCGDEEYPRRSADPEPEPSDGAKLIDFDPGAIPADLQAFPIGVQASALESTSALLLAAASSNEAHLLRVWRDAGPGQIKLVQELELAPLDGFLRTKVRGLGPGRYRYAFFDRASSRRSPIGTFRTTFAPDDLRPLSIGGLVCTSQRNRPFRALELVAADPPDVLCHLGDMSYNDEAGTLAEYRALWRDQLSQPEYVAAYAAAGLYATWDDHEIDNNFSQTSVDPERFTAGRQAFYETLAIEPGLGGRLWRSYRWGKSAEFFVLDCRSERLPATRQTPEAQYLSRAQLDWLKDGLVKSPCRYKVILNSVPITRFPALWAPGLADRWEGYAAQRTELIDHLVAHNLPGVLFLTGDFHCGFISRIEPEGPASRYLEIAVGPTGNGPNPLALLVESGAAPRGDVFPEGQFLYSSGVVAATTTVFLDPLNEEVGVRFVDARSATKGNVLFDGLLPRGV
ncbi:MAG: alkaline phosphatase D family protein [Deltaproteobacteria bacterium]|nr:alkaline phosphatase D family protein [Deltaproteobacteria bacterium]